MKSLRNVSRACNTAAYHAITASKLAVLRTTCANFCGAIRCDDAGRVRVVAVTVLIASSICGVAHRLYPEARTPRERERHGSTEEPGRDADWPGRGAGREHRHRSSSSNVGR